MSRNFWVALVILLIAIAWFSYDFLTPDEIVASDRTLADINAEAEALVQDLPATKIRAKVSVAQEKQRTSILSGRTENKRTVVVRAEVGGLVLDRAVELGDRVRKGDPLCVLEQDEREARVLEAEDLLRETKLEYEGQAALRSSGLQIERQIAAAKARVTQAEATLLQRQKELERATIRAPFSGFIEETQVELGDLLQPGTPCVTLIDLDPMKVVAQVSEKEIHHFDVGTTAEARLPSGKTIEGTVTFIGQQSNANTRTFVVEVLVENPDFSIRSGLTAELLIPLEKYHAHKVAVALIGINDDGVLGIQTVGDASRVKFAPITIVTEDDDGIWVTGLPDIATLITVGQDFVIPGEIVEVVFEDQI